jgi:aryl-alcohol dehydrogenase-like predicted oxidoreductase
MACAGILAKGDFGFKSQDNSGNPIDIYRYAGKESIIKECEDSLKRFGTDYIDLYQMHWPDKTTPIEESMEAVLAIDRAGESTSGGCEQLFC